MEKYKEEKEELLTQLRLAKKQLKEDVRGSEEERLWRVQARETEGRAQALRKVLEKQLADEKRANTDLKLEHTNLR
jgi:hypothetical protein